MNYAIILASGTGERAGANLPKQFLKIKNKTILEYTLSAFNNNTLTDKIILVAGKQFLDKAVEIASKFKKVHKIIIGGKTRQESSFNGTNSVSDDSANVLIHDACRPFIKDELINRCYEALSAHDAIDTAIETSDTIVQIDDNNFITNTFKRQTLRRCQTPQGFKAGLIKQAHKLAKEKNICVTDDVGLIVTLSLAPVFVVTGDIENTKITYPDDIKHAEGKL